MIAIIDYGIGNTRSLEYMFNRMNLRCNVTKNSRDLEAASALIFPGVGAFDIAIKNLQSNPAFYKMIQVKIFEEKVPLVGICLGMQLLGESSEEGSFPGLGWIKGKTKKLRDGNDSQQIHVGWSSLLESENYPKFFDHKDPNKYFFNHSYFFDISDRSKVVATLKVAEKVPVVVKEQNIWGVQFHPEKSYKQGEIFMKRILNDASIF